MKPICVFMCEKSGVMAGPWAAAGFECYCVDIAHSIRRERVEGLIHYVWGDVRSWTPPDGCRVVFMAVFSPCTDLAVSGARDFERKGLPMLMDGLELFNAGYRAAKWSGAPFCCENPVGVISTHFRKPDYTFDPCDYAGYLADPSLEAYTKKTCLWTGNRFIMPPKRHVVPTLGSMMHLLPPTDDRQQIRSLTPAGFAMAVFESNCPMERKVVA